MTKKTCFQMANIFKEMIVSNNQKFRGRKLGKIPFWKLEPNPGSALRLVIKHREKKSDFVFVMWFVFVMLLFIVSASLSCLLPFVSVET